MFWFGLRPPQRGGLVWFGSQHDAAFTTGRFEIQEGFKPAALVKGKALKLLISRRVNIQSDRYIFTAFLQPVF